MTAAPDTPGARTRGAGHLVIRRSRPGQLRNLAVLALFVVAYVVGSATGVLTGWIVAYGIVVFGAVFLVGLVGVARSGPAAPPLLVLGPEGIEVPGARTVNWSELAGVRLSGLRPRWLFWFSFGATWVSFLPRLGVELPGIGTRRRRPARNGWATRVWGSPMTLALSTTTVTATDVLRAVTDLSTVPVIRA